MDRIIEQSSTPASQEAVETTPSEAAETTAQVQQPSAPEAAAEIDPDLRRRILAEADPDEAFASNPKLKRHLDGKAGQLADEIVKSKRDRIIKEARIEEIERTERDIRRTDGERASYLRDQADTLRTELADEERKAATGPEATYSSIMTTIAQFQEQLPPAVKKQLEGKVYPGTFSEGFAAYVGDMVKAAREHAVSEYEAKQLPILRRQVQAQINGGEPSIDMGQGPTAGTVVVTDKDIADMDLDRYNTLFDEKTGEPKAGVIYRPR